MSKQSLLLVDHDTRSMRVLEVSLRKAGFTVTTAVSVGDALEKLEVHPPDLIISETTFPSDQADGFELRRRVRGTQEWSEIPFIFLTAEQTIENKIKGLELGVDDYLTKPIYIKEIVTRINILLQKRQRTRFEERRDGRTRFAGRVADMPVVDVIQTIEISRKSGVIQFVGDRGRQAAIYFRDGRVIDAEAGALQGEDAVYRLLTWSEGEFEVVFRTVRRREVIATSSQGLLMEGMRRLDEWSRLLEQLPPLTHRFEVDAGELAVRLGDIPDDNNGILRLVDGKRTLLEVIDASDVGDLECLQAISRLYFEEMLIDLDHGKSVRRTSGQMLITSSLDAPSPTPIEDAASGPIEDLAARAVAEGSGPIELPATLDAAPDATPVESTAPVETAAIEAEITAPTTVEPEPRPSGSIPVGDGDIDEEVANDDTPSPFMGSYRQSSLRLIDEAVAAAQAIEPSLFEDEKPASATDDSKAAPLSISPATALPGLVRLSIQKPSAPGPEDEEETARSNGTPRSILDDEVELDYPSGIDADDPTPMPIVRRSKPRPAVGREDSGLRMIGSLGRDRAETSGELTSAGATAPIPVSETQRELVTIHPRRITREVPIVGDVKKDADKDPKAVAAVDSAEAITPRSTPIAKAEAPLPPKPPTTPAVEAKTEAPPKSPLPSETMRIKPLDRKLPVDDADDDIRPPTNSSAKFVVVAIAVLAAIAVYLVVKKNRTRTEVPVVVTSDAATQVTPITLPDASVEQPAIVDDAAAPVADASVVVDGPVAIDAAVAVVADAGSAGSAAPPDRETQAKALYQQALGALEEGDPEKALRLADQSLKMRNAARAHLVRATALQRLDRIDEAIEATNNAEKLSPNYAGIYDQRGRIFWSARRFDEARVAFEKYLELQPTGKRADEVKRMLERSP